MGNIKNNPVDLKNFYNAITKNSPLMYGHQFIVTFSGKDLPGYLQTSGGQDPTSLTYYVKAASVPQYEIENSVVSFLSQEFVVPRQVKYGGQAGWEVSVLLDNDIRHYRTLYNWQQEFASLQLSGGGKKIIPSVQAHVSLLDSTLQYVTRKFTLQGVFPSKIPDLTMQYQNNSNLTEFKCTFTYQYLYDETDGNPLDARVN